MTATLLGILAVLASFGGGGWVLAHEERTAGRDRLSYRAAKTAVEAQVVLGLFGLVLLTVAR